MLAYKAPPRRPIDLADLRYPLLGSYKFDGYRAVVRGGRLLSRNLLPIPNKEVRLYFGGLRSLEGCDGELIYGDPTAPDCFKLTSSAVTTRGARRAGVRFFVFDNFLHPTWAYSVRHSIGYLGRTAPGVELVRNTILGNAFDVLRYEEKALALGYEGVMLRAPGGAYKHGRSTLAEQYLVALKRFEEFEAEIVAVLPRMRNDNALGVDALGRAKRSKRRENMVPQPCVGKFLVREIGERGRYVGLREMECSTGQFTLEECERLWRARARLPGKVLKCRRQRDATGKRFPRAAGFRSRIDF